MIKPKTLLVTIFTRNRNNILGVNLGALYNQTYSDFDILIIDDASDIPVIKDEFINLIKKRFEFDGSKFSIMRTQTNNGIAKNRADILPTLKEYDFVMDLNDDHLMEPHCIERLVKALSHDDVCAVGSATPMLYWPHRKICREYKGGIMNLAYVKDDELNLTRDVDHVYTDESGKELTRPIEVVHASQFMYKPEFLNEGDVPLNYSILCFTEETSLSLSLKKNSGLKVMFQPDAINWHIQFTTGGIRDVPYSTWDELKKRDWAIFTNKWQNWVKEHQKEWMSELK